MAPGHDTFQHMPEDPVGDIATAIKGLQWYHTLELAPGVVTPGWFDLRTLAPKLPFPSLTGARCLDVGTFDGFWAFEMERRGAAEVVAVDLLDPQRWDWPYGAEDASVQAIGERKRAGSGFELAAKSLGSRVVRHDMSVYDLDPAVLGEFDFVYVGSLLLHLRDPVRALERVRSLCRGSLLLVDAIDLTLSVRHPRRPVAGLDGQGRPWWWKPNVAGLARMVESAGFTVTASPQRVLMPPGAGQLRARPKLRQLRHGAYREAVFTAWRGDPHAAISARPRER
jgi:tRNA (mo5U34)-methyltransferase